MSLFQAQNALQNQLQSQTTAYPQLTPQSSGTGASAPTSASLYPSLTDYMGLSLDKEILEQHMGNVVANPIQVYLIRVYPFDTGSTK